LDTKVGGVLSDDITNNFNIKIFASFEKEAKAFAEINHTNVQARKTYFYKMMLVWGVARGVTGIILEI
jgi:hypothetical protein